MPFGLQEFSSAFTYFRHQTRSLLPEISKLVMECQVRKVSKIAKFSNIQFSPMTTLTLIVHIINAPLMEFKNSALQKQYFKGSVEA